MRATRSNGARAATAPATTCSAISPGPEEFPIEYTAEVLQIDDSYEFHGPEYWKWPPGRLDQWGITPPHTARWKRIQDMVLFTPGTYRI